MNFKNIIFYLILFLSPILARSQNAIDTVRIEGYLRSGPGLEYLIPVDKSVMSVLEERIKIKEVELQNYETAKDEIHFELGDTYHWLGHILEEKKLYNKALDAHMLSLEHYQQSIYNDSFKINMLSGMDHATTHVNELLRLIPHKKEDIDQERVELCQMKVSEFEEFILLKKNLYKSLKEKSKKILGNQAHLEQKAEDRLGEYQDGEENHKNLLMLLKDCQMSQMKEKEVVKLTPAEILRCGIGILSSPFSKLKDSREVVEILELIDGESQAIDDELLITKSRRRRMIERRLELLKINDLRNLLLALSKVSPFGSKKLFKKALIKEVKFYGLLIDQMKTPKLESADIFSIFKNKF